MSLQETAALKIFFLVCFKVKAEPESDDMEFEDICEMPGAVKQELQCKDEVDETKLFVMKSGTYHCVVCPYKNKRIHEMKRHIATHIGVKKRSCPYCDVQCASATAMKRHIRTHTGEKPYSCDICDFRARQTGTLQTHMLTHTGEKAFRCDLCDSNFVTKSSMTRHVKRIHTTPDEKRYSCVFCDYKTDESNRLKRHIMIHTGDKCFACALCDYRTCDKGTLVRHMAYHTGERRYPCDECDRRFFTRNNLWSHKKRHVKDRKKQIELQNLPHVKKERKEYVCTVCSYKSRIVSRLKDHVRKHTGEKPYACGLCDWQFPSRSGLNKHFLRKHSTEKPFDCDQCDYKAALKSDLNVHLKKHDFKVPSSEELVYFSPETAHTASAVYTDGKHFICHDCGLVCGSKALVKEHILSEHLR